MSKEATAVERVAAALWAANNTRRTDPLKNRSPAEWGRQDIQMQRHYRRLARDAIAAYEEVGNE
ncbi:MAG: hypothetical protein ACRDMV_04915 [Streptosporangiales bacterium]